MAINTNEDTKTVESSLTPDQIAYYKGECKKAYSGLLDALKISIKGEETATITNETIKVLEFAKTDPMMEVYFNSFIRTGEGWVAAVNSEKKETILAEIDKLKDLFVEQDFVPVNFDVAWHEKQLEESFKKETDNAYESIEQAKQFLNEKMATYREHVEVFKDKVVETKQEVDNRFTVGEQVGMLAAAVVIIYGVCRLAGAIFGRGDTSGDVVILDEYVRS